MLEKTQIAPEFSSKNKQGKLIELSPGVTRVGYKLNAMLISAEWSKKRGGEFNLYLPPIIAI